MASGPNDRPQMDMVYVTSRLLCTAERSCIAGHMLFKCLVGLQIAYDSVYRGLLCGVLARYGLFVEMIAIIL